MIAEALEKTPGVRVVPPERLRKAIELRGLDPGDEGSRERIRELAAALGGELVLDATLRERGRGLLASSIEDPFLLEFRFLGDGEELGGGVLEGPGPLAAVDRLAYSAARGLASGSEPVRMSAVFSRDLFRRPSLRHGSPGAASHRCRGGRALFRDRLALPAEIPPGSGAASRMPPATR